MLASKSPRRVTVVVKCKAVNSVITRDAPSGGSQLINYPPSIVGPIIRRCLLDYTIHLLLILQCAEQPYPNIIPPSLFSPLCVRQLYIQLQFTFLLVQCLESGFVTELTAGIWTLLFRIDRNDSTKKKLAVGRFPPSRKVSYKKSAPDEITKWCPIVLRHCRKALVQCLSSSHCHRGWLDIASYLGRRSGSLRPRALHNFMRGVAGLGTLCNVARYLGNRPSLGCCGGSGIRTDQTPIATIARLEKEAANTFDNGLALWQKLDVGVEGQEDSLKIGLLDEARKQEDPQPPLEGYHITSRASAIVGLCQTPPYLKSQAE
ncbi:hypothetical protein J6590_079218 [Homalodisca vitripennis]|nr:hypothetical protein J6590_079218 [Homalodisca vitripennis]